VFVFDVLNRLCWRIKSLTTVTSENGGLAKLFNRQPFSERFSYANRPLFLLFNIHHFIDGYAVLQSGYQEIPA